MAWNIRYRSLPGRFRRRIVLLGGLFVLIWFVFLDSHSLYNRIQWHRERSRLATENARLRVELQDLEARLSRPLTDEEVERIAREQYGMSRPGEIVFPVEETTHE